MVIKGGVLADWVFDSNTGLFTESLRFPFFLFFFANTSGTLYQDELLNKICLNKVYCLDWFVSLLELLEGCQRAGITNTCTAQTIQISKSNDQHFGKPGGTPPLLRFGTAAQHKFQLGLDLSEELLLWWDLFTPLCLESRGNAHLSGDQVPEHKEWNVIWVGSCDLSKIFVTFLSTSSFGTP
jgi:hypothetical protein